MTGKRSYTGGPMVPYYPGSKAVETVKYLRLIASRFLKNNANAGELREAWSMVEAEIPGAKSSGREAEAVTVLKRSADELHALWMGEESERDDFRRMESALRRVIESWPAAALPAPGEET